ncbi:hypothetical protein FHU39_000948 [Flexivirga oryzae]|uniref:Amidohydrolase-related domain-containing protein n=1 Tax=Flexivirga oryzae TaxID=1794944 RepID=A0A839N4H0_9MICO|nr:hypothetical protein [Flexivirga oryzae]
MDVSSRRTPGASALADAPGEYVSIGALEDAHVHAADRDKEELLRYGIASVRDMGSTGLATDLQSDCWPTRRSLQVQRGGRVFDAPYSTLRTAWPWHDDDDLKRIIYSLPNSWSHIKIYSSFPSTQIPWLCQQAVGRGLTITIHPGADALLTAIPALDEVAHITSVLGYIEPLPHAIPQLIQRWSAGFTKIEIDDIINRARLAQLCPTLSVFHAWLEAKSFDGVPQNVRSTLRSSRKVVEAAWENMIMMANLLFHAGVTFRIGSDTPNRGVAPGYSLWKEVDLISQAIERPRITVLEMAASGTGETIRVRRAVLDRFLCTGVPPAPEDIQTGKE